jgi:hypothetical protein
VIGALSDILLGVMEYLDKLALFMALHEFEYNYLAGECKLSLCGYRVLDAERTGVIPANNPDLRDSTMEFDPGVKYGRVMAQSHGSCTQRFIRYFVCKETGAIFGAESWRKVNFKRQYGTLDTILDWDWSGYYGVSMTGVDTLVPKAERRDAKGKDGVLKDIRLAINSARGANSMYGGEVPVE